MAILRSTPCPSVVEIVVRVAEVLMLSHLRNFSKGIVNLNRTQFMLSSCLALHSESIIAFVYQHSGGYTMSIA